MFFATRMLAGQPSWPQSPRLYGAAEVIAQLGFSGSCDHSRKRERLTGTYVKPCAIDACRCGGFVAGRRRRPSPWADVVQANSVEFVSWFRAGGGRRCHIARVKLTNLAVGKPGRTAMCFATRFD
jgi:hypothetical protein